MKKGKLDQEISQEEIVSPKGDAGVLALTSFFSLLLKIDRRNNPGLYEHNKSGTSPDQTQNGLIAFASINLDDRLYITSIGVHRRLDGKGYRITYPTRKVGEQSVSVCYPIEPVLSKEIEMAICKRASELFGE